MSYKVLQVHTLPLLYGSGQSVLLMMKGAAAAGFDVSLACSAVDGPLTAAAIDNGFKVFRLKYLRREVKVFRDVLAVLELSSIIKREKFDVVHTNNSKAGIIGRFAAELAHTPVIIHTIRGYTALYGHNPAIKIFFYILKKIASSFSDKIICISQSVKNWALKLNLSAASKFEVIYSAIDETHFKNVNVNCGETLLNYGVAKNSIVIAQVSKLWNGKGLDVFIKGAGIILQKNRNVHFLIIGEGLLENKLQNLISEYGLEEKITITGFVSNIERILKCIDIGVLLSEFEGMGRAILEYMASGLPTVATNVGGIPELIAEGKNGFLIEPGDVNNFAAKIQLLIDDELLRSSFGLNARQSFVSKFTSAEMNNRIVDIYKGLIRQKEL